MAKVTGQGKGAGSSFGACLTCDGVGYVGETEDEDRLEAGAESASGAEFAFAFGEVVDVPGAAVEPPFRGEVLGRSRDDDGGESYAVMPEGGDRTRMVAGDLLRLAPQ